MTVISVQLSLGKVNWTADTQMYLLSTCGRVVEYHCCGYKPKNVHCYTKQVMLRVSIFCLPCVGNLKFMIHMTKIQ
jgi:hypothetical protein